MDADDLLHPGFSQVFIGLNIIPWPRAGGGGQDAGGCQPVQEFLALDRNQVTQHFLPAVDIVGHGMDMQFFEHSSGMLAVLSVRTATCLDMGFFP